MSSSNVHVDNYDSDSTTEGSIPANIKLYDGLREEECTTLMVRNIPNKYSQRMVLGVIHKHGFKGTFDFLYVPSDFATRVNVGYCFVNFTSPKYAQEFAKVFHRMHLNGFKSKKLVQISLGTTQGFDANIKKFEDSTLCSEFIAPEFHPIIFNTTTGEEVEFRSLMPDYKPMPPSRLENPSYWADKDEKPKWEGGSLYPTVVDQRLKVEEAPKEKKHEEQQPKSRQDEPRGSRELGYDMSPRSRALHSARYGQRASSIGAPPGFEQGSVRYGRHHGHGGYPLPTQELYEMYSNVGPGYQLPHRARRASIGAPPGLSQTSPLTPDFTEFVTRLEHDYPERRNGGSYMPPPPRGPPPAQVDRPRW